jgi:hypothetical protein
MVAGLLCGACVSEPGAVIKTSGPANTSTVGLKGVFKIAADNSAANPRDALLAADFLHQGFALVSSNCRQYFRSAGEAQQWLQASRDVLAVGSTAAISLMTLEGERPRDISKVALGAAFGASSIDLYTRQYLFGAENISTVEGLVQKALKKHQLLAESGPTYDYGSAVDQLMDNQNICSARRIAALAKDAIAKGDIDGDISTDGSLEAQQDAKALKELGDELNKPSSLTPEQAGALWWLFVQSYRPEDLPIIQQRLSGLPPSSNPIDATTKVYVAGWPHEKAVRTALDHLSFATRTRFAADIERYKTQTPTGAIRATAVAEPTFTSAIGSPGRGGLITLQVR